MSFEIGTKIDRPKERKFLTEEELRKKAPAVFAQKPIQEVSRHYTFVPTFEIIKDFEKIGWLPVDARQQRTKRWDPDSQKHTIRFGNSNSEFKKVGDVLPEIVIMNSHDRSFAFTFEVGLFRLACSNGLVVADSSFSQMQQKHRRVEFSYIQQLCHEAVAQFDQVGNKIEDYKSIQLDKGQRRQFAMKAIEKHWGSRSVIEPNEILIERREADSGVDLFSTYNVIQENLTKGGLSYMAPRENGQMRRRQTRPIKNIVRDFSLNQSLWAMMESYRASKSF
jgi:hypothetical protein